jgi:hypothetical protein
MRRGAPVKVAASCQRSLSLSQFLSPALTTQMLATSQPLAHAAAHAGGVPQEEEARTAITCRETATWLIHARGRPLALLIDLLGLDLSNGGPARWPSDIMLYTCGHIQLTRPQRARALACRGWCAGASCYACACRAKTASRCFADAFSSELSLWLDIDVLGNQPWQQQPSKR